MAEINGNESMSASFNGKTINLGMFNGSVVFGGASDITLSGTIGYTCTNCVGSPTSYSVSGAAGSTGTFTFTLTANNNYSLSGVSALTAGKGDNLGTTTCSVVNETDLSCTQAYTIPSSNAVDNFSVTASAIYTNPLSANITGSSTALDGQTITLTCNASGGDSPYSYEWSRTSGDGNIIGSSSSQTARIQKSGAGTTTFSCQVTDANNDTASDSHSITYQAYNTLSFSSSSVSFQGSGGSSNVFVTTNAGSYSVSSSPSWITTSINGNTLTLTASNNSGSARSGSVVVVAGNNSGTISVSQSGTPRQLTVTPGSVSLNASGGSGTISVVTDDPNGWDSTSVGNFYSISPTTGSTGTTSVTVTANGANNSGNTLSDTFVIQTIDNSNNAYVNVSQSGAAPTITLSPSNQSHANSGSTITSTITSNQTGAFSVGSTPSWLSCSIVSTSNVRCVSNANNGAQRFATVAINQNNGTASLSVTQAGVPDDFTLSSTTLGFTNSASSTTVGLSNLSGPSTVSVSDNQPWISSKTNGSSTVTVTVTANTGAIRQGIVTVTKGSTSKTISVAQATGQTCFTYSVIPTGTFLVWSYQACGNNFVTGPTGIPTQPGVQQTICAVQGTVNVTTGGGAPSLVGSCSA